jgi:hypothetical protein
MASLIFPHDGQLWKIANVGAGFMPARIAYAGSFSVGDKPRPYEGDPNGLISKR